MKIWHALEIEIDRVAESAITLQLWNAQTTGLEISEDTADKITVRAYFETAPEVEKIQAQISRALRLSDLPDAALRSIKSLTIADQDWLTEWKKGYEPVPIGEKLLICPSWKRAQVSATNRLIIQIDPGMAFGTGTHETTRGCLEMIEKYWQDGALLDVGTGTGILAIAAIKLFPAARVVGFDVDPEAIDVALENAEINSVADDLVFEVNKISSFHGQFFEMVLANLTADVILPLASDFPQVLRPEGILVVSGILREQGNEIITALSGHNFSLLESKPDGEWITFAFKLEK